MVRSFDTIPIAEGDTRNLRMRTSTVGNTVEITVSLDNQANTNMAPFVDSTNPILGSG